MHRKNFPSRRAEKKASAEARKAEREKLSARQVVQMLDRANLSAKKERAKLAKKLAEQE